MKVWAVRLGTSVNFTAYILQGDRESAVRTWICIRAAESAPAVSWLGCWSRISEPNVDQVQQILRDIEEFIGESVRVGPYGPTIGRLGYFESWDSWGAGTPSPIVGFRPWESVKGDIGELSIDLLDFPNGGVCVDG